VIRGITAAFIQFLSSYERRSALKAGSHAARSSKAGLSASPDSSQGSPIAQYFRVEFRPFVTIIMKATTNQEKTAK